MGNRREPSVCGADPAQPLQSSQPFASFDAFRSTSAGRYVLELGLVFAAYLLGGRIGLIVPFTSGNVSPVWPSAGIAMAALLLVGYRVWPAIATAAFFVNLFTPIPALAALGIAAGNTAGPLAGAWLTRQISGFTPSLTRLKDVFAIILIAAPTGAAISACVGVTVLFGTGAAPWVTFARAWAVWWLGDAMGGPILTPLALTLFDRRIMIARRRARPRSRGCAPARPSTRPSTPRRVAAPPSREPPSRRPAEEAPPPAGPDLEEGPPERGLWPRFLAGSLLIIVAMTTATAVSLLVYLKGIARGLGGLPSVHSQLEVADPGNPQTILILGSDAAPHR